MTIVACARIELILRVVRGLEAKLEAIWRPKAIERNGKMNQTFMSRRYVFDPRSRGRSASADPIRTRSNWGERSNKLFDGKHDSRLQIQALWNSARQLFEKLDCKELLPNILSGMILSPTRRHLRTYVFSERLMAFGCVKNSERLCLEYYSEQSKQWTVLNETTINFENFAAVNFGERMFITGGETTFVRREVRLSCNEFASIIDWISSGLFRSRSSSWICSHSNQSMLRRWLNRDGTMALQLLTSRSTWLVVTMATNIWIRWSGN